MMLAIVDSASGAAYAATTKEWMTSDVAGSTGARAAPAWHFVARWEQAVRLRWGCLLSLPPGRSKHGTYDVTYLLLVNVVREVCRVPDHHILVADTLSVVEAVNVGGSVRLG